jgi:WD40 repeat protein
VYIWDSVSGEEVARIELFGHRSEGLSFSPDGSKIAFTVVKTGVVICDAGTGKRLKTLEVPGSSSRSVAFSPDGTRVASGSYWGRSHTVWVWDVETGEVVHQLKRHTHEVLSVAFSRDPEGSRLFSGGKDGTLRVWDSESGEDLLAIATGSPVWGIAVSPRGNTVATAGADGNIRLWETERPSATLLHKRRVVAAARKLVDERIAQFSSPAEVNESLFTDDTINAVVKKVALEILQARRGVKGDPDTSQDL